MGNTVSRIKEYIDYKCISIRKFEESLGFSNGSFASQFKNNKTIGVDKVENILHIYDDINPEWLLTGKGNMLLKDKADNIRVLSGSHNNNISTSINSSAQIRNSPRIIDNKADLENNTLKVKIEFLEQMLSEKDKMLSEKDKMIAEKERYIVLLEQQISKH